MNKLGESEGGKGSRLFLVFFCPLNLKKRGVDPASGALLVVIFLWLVCRANSVIRFAHRRFSVLPEKSSGGRWVGKKGWKVAEKWGKSCGKVGERKKFAFPRWKELGYVVWSGVVVGRNCPRVWVAQCRDPHEEILLYRIQKNSDFLTQKNGVLTLLYTIFRWISSFSPCRPAGIGFASC